MIFLLCGLAYVFILSFKLCWINVSDLHTMVNQVSIASNLHPLFVNLNDILLTLWRIRITQILKILLLNNQSNYKYKCLLEQKVVKNSIQREQLLIGWQPWQKRVWHLHALKLWSQDHASEILMWRWYWTRSFLRTPKLVPGSGIVFPLTKDPLTHTGSLSSRPHQQWSTGASPNCIRTV